MNLVKDPQFHAILGHRAIIRLRLVEMTDTEIFKPNTSGAVYSTSGQEDLPTINMVREFPKVFSETVGILDGSWTVQLNLYNMHREKYLFLSMKS